MLLLNQVRNFGTQHLLTMSIIFKLASDVEFYHYLLLPLITVNKSTNTQKETQRRYCVYIYASLLYTGYEVNTYRSQRSTID